MAKERTRVDTQYIIENMRTGTFFWAAGNGRPQYKEIAITHALQHEKTDQA
jgi:hypothetical protein